MDQVRVMIIEDDDRISEIHRRFTEKTGGFEVVGIANSLSVGLEMWEVLKPDLILLDLYFPDGYGIDLLRHIRSQHEETDIILITAAKEVAPLRDSLRGGVFDYIIKPVIFSRFQESLLQYHDYFRRLQKGDALDQRDVDRLLRPAPGALEDRDSLPKGVDPITLGKIRKVFDIPPEEGLSAEEVGTALGVSRTTARRYLEYLVSGGYLVADLVYQKVGRPERRYFRPSR